MYNPIEIPDSDDELAESSIRAKPAVTNGNEASETTPEKKRKISMSAAKSTDVLMVKSTESLSSDATSSPPSSSSANQTKPQVRHRARKTQHTVRNAAVNEIQFESILLDSDTKEKETYSTAAPEQKELRLPSVSDPIKNRVNQFLGSDEVEQIIQRIANERVRCNFLLATYKLPDMNFLLNTHTDMLKFQFRERLKQRKERATTATTTNAPNATVKTKSVQQ